MLHEARVYRLLVDAAPLRFRAPLRTRLRQRVSQTLYNLAKTIEPCSSPST